MSSEEQGSDELESVESRLDHGIKTFSNSTLDNIENSHGTPTDPHI